MRDINKNRMNTATARSIYKGSHVLFMFTVKFIGFWRCWQNMNEEYEIVHVYLTQTAR